MKHARLILLSTLLLLVLSVLAVAAQPARSTDAVLAADIPNGLVAAPKAEAAEAASGVLATQKYNLIAIPLDASGSISPFKASGLAAYHGSSVKQVVRWDAAAQQYKAYTPGVSPPPLDFNLQVGGAYFILLDNTSSNVFSIVGNVPAPGSVSFALVRETLSTGCKYNLISIPLDQSGITNAAQLAAAIGGVSQVVRWDAATQQYKSYVPGVSPPPLNFAVQIGYPYFVCLNSSAPTQWP